MTTRMRARAQTRVTASALQQRAGPGRDQQHVRRGGSRRRRGPACQAIASRHARSRGERSVLAIAVLRSRTDGIHALAPLARQQLTARAAVPSLQSLACHRCICSFLISCELSLRRPRDCSNLPFARSPALRPLAWPCRGAAGRALDLHLSLPDRLATRALALRPAVDLALRAIALRLHPALLRAMLTRSQSLRLGGHLTVSPRRDY